jgi:drug/metabolite transporter (DMT)-like permease
MTVSTALNPHQALDQTHHTSASIAKSLLTSLQTLLKQSEGGIILGIALAAIACASIFIVIAERDLSPSATAFDRLFIATIAFGVWSRWQIRSQPGEDIVGQGIGWRNWVLFGVAGGSFAASLTCSAWSLTQTSVANSTLLNNMMPIFTTLGAWLFLRQRFSLRFVVGLGVAIGGMMAIGIQDLHLSSQQMMGDAVALFAAVLLATVILSIEQLRSRFSASVTMMGICLAGSLAMIPIVLFQGESVLPSSWQSGFAIVALALVCQVIGHGLLTHSLKQFSSGLVSVSMLVIPVLSAMLAMILFAQQLSLINDCAFAIVLSGIYLSISGSRGS